MNSFEIAKAINFIKPNAQFSVDDEKIIWLDQEQNQPTEEEIKQGWLKYQEETQKNITQVETKRQALLAKLGITEEEAKLLLS